MAYMTRQKDRPLGYLLNRVAMKLRQEVTATVLEPAGLTFSEFVCLQLLAQSSGLSNAELARSAAVTAQAMNAVLQSLQKRSLVTRPATVSSGRARPAVLTRAGRALLTRTGSGISDAEGRLLGKLDEQDRIDLRRILAALDEQRESIDVHRHIGGAAWSADAAPLASSPPGS
jgi:DNA-binding MarR family transcriptional regulator